MPYETSKCKITVLKRTVNKDIADQYLDVDGIVPCDIFKEGQEFLVEQPFEMPKSFGCAWAWADLRNDVVLVASGGNLPWIKQGGTSIAGCTDWFRPVIFKIERVG